ncbi:Uncharacterised protein [Legionella lansingensis]|uniref:Uncharacterized protein n=2 Tax=Legionella lansingensis TaxID=45067 RepID=A0A0W0V7T4_9GAMM|nr:hypothetical protein [Legionella lansingensis]KTD15933.1 hypothetical protein Llan_2614 [Legionella lansingensis]SNV48492.1 Uncharacterised protein [Legionella lansingensis]
MWPFSSKPPVFFTEEKKSWRNIFIGNILEINSTSEEMFSAFKTRDILSAPYTSPENLEEILKNIDNSEISPAENPIIKEWTRILCHVKSIGFTEEQIKKMPTSFVLKCSAIVFAAGVKKLGQAANNEGLGIIESNYMKLGGVDAQRDKKCFLENELPRLAAPLLKYYLLREILGNICKEAAQDLDHSFTLACENYQKDKDIAALNRACQHLLSKAASTWGEDNRLSWLFVEGTEKDKILSNPTTGLSFGKIELFAATLIAGLQTLAKRLKALLGYIFCAPQQDVAEHNPSTEALPPSYPPSLIDGLGVKSSSDKDAPSALMNDRQPVLKDDGNLLIDNINEENRTSLLPQ